MKRNALFILATMAWVLTAKAQLNEVVRAFADNELMRHGTLGVCVVDVGTNAQVAAFNDDVLLTPASTIKALTTATALGVLGPEYRFSTWLEYDGRINSDGTLEGNLYVRGSGDPTLASPELEGVSSLSALMRRWVDAVHAAGIKSVSGSVIGDAAEMEGEEIGRDWEWQDIGNYYGGGAWALNIHENLYALRFQQHPVEGEAPSIREITPDIPGLLVVNQLVSGSPQSGDQAYIFGGPYSLTRYVRGSIPSGDGVFSIKGSIPNPPLFTAQLLTETLQEEGIDVDSEPLGIFESSDRKAVAMGKRRVLDVVYSPVLKEVVRRANHESVNLYCEALLRAVGKRLFGKGNADAGIDGVRAFWRDRGLPLDEAIIKDGSGLSRGNGISARQMAMMFAKIGRDEALFSPFVASLPKAGQSGTIKRVLSGTEAAGQVIAKSGSMSRVRAYAGYINTQSGRQLAFAVMADRFVGSAAEVQRELEQLLLAIYQL